MKKISTFLIVLVLLNSVMFLQAQNNPFSVKKKQPGSSVRIPQAVQPLNRTKQAFTPSKAQFKPVQASFSSLKLDRRVFSNPGFDANGRLVFVEGSLPSTYKSVGKSITEQDQCIEYLSALQQVLGISDPSSEFEIVK